MSTLTNRPKAVRRFTDDKHVADDYPLPEEPEDRPKRQSCSALLNFWTSIVLHIVLILLHVVLLCVWQGEYEHSLVIALGNPTATASTVLVVILQGFNIIYTAVLLFLVQKLAFRRNLGLNQTLTALHDRTSAWTGLGSSVRVLSRQIRLPTTVWGILLIALYSLGISGLHITSPSLLRFVTFNQTSHTNVTTTLSTPFTAIDYDEAYVDAIGALSYLQLNPGAQTLGMEGNTLYDRLPDNLGVGTTMVNATSIHVTCGLMNASASIEGSGSTEYITALQVVDPGYGIAGYDIHWTESNYIRLLALDGTANTVLAIVFSNISDDSGATPPNFPIVLGDTVVNITGSFQVAGCSVHTRNSGPIEVSANSKTPTQPILRTNSVEWTAWTEPDASAVDALAGDVSLIVMEAQEFLSNVAPCIETLSVACNDSSLNFNALERFVIASLLGYNPGNSISDTPLPISYPEPLTLARLEMAIENATAAVFWLDSQIAEWNSGSASQGEAILTLETSMSRLDLNETSIIAGLTISSLLLLLAIILTCQPSALQLQGVDEAFDSPGILQIVWLSGRVPTVAARIAERVSRPRTDDLRAAGVLEAQSALLLRDSELAPLGRNAGF